MLEERRVTNKSRTFLAFELLETEVVPKVYSFPKFKAANTGRKPMEVIGAAIDRLPEKDAGITSSFTVIDRFVSARPSLEVEVLAIDCVASDAARIKIYIRNRATDWDSVEHMVTLAGAIDFSTISKSFEELRCRWSILFNIDLVAEPGHDLKQSDHLTAGILFNFEIKCGSSAVVPKVYVPVRHFAKSDASIMRRLKSSSNRSVEPD